MKCKHYERLDSVLGNKPVMRPSIVINLFESSNANNSSDSQKSDDDLENSIESTSNNEQSSDLSTEKLPSNLSGDQVDEQCDKKPPAKKKGCRDEKIEKAMDTLVSGLTKSFKQ